MWLGNNIISLGFSAVRKRKVRRSSPSIHPVLLVRFLIHGLVGIHNHSIASVDGRKGRESWLIHPVLILPDWDFQRLGITPSIPSIRVIKPSLMGALGLGTTTSVSGWGKENGQKVNHSSSNWLSFQLFYDLSQFQNWTSTNVGWQEICSFKGYAISMPSPYCDFTVCWENPSFISDSANTWLVKRTLMTPPYHWEIKPALPHLY